ncbi:MAG: MnhB domain-containing protein [Gemmatimonadota bacterium]
MIRAFDSLLLRVVLAPLVAAMQLFAFYVLLHGHYSPGGGFQAGILLGASMILPRLARGQPPGRLALTPGGAMILTAVGLLLFTGLGAVVMLGGAPMLDYGALPLGGELRYRRSLAILLIEVGVTLAVAGAMLAIFFALAGRLGGEPRR